MSRYLNIFAFSMTWCLCSLCSLCSNPVLIKSVIILEILLTLRRYKTQKCDPSRGKVRTTANCGCGDGGSRQEGAVLPGDAHWGTQWNPRTRVFQFWHQYAFAELRSFIFIICKPQPKKYKYSFAKPRPLPLSFNNWYSQCIQRRCLPVPSSCAGWKPNCQSKWFCGQFQVERPGWPLRILWINSSTISQNWITLSWIRHCDLAGDSGSLVLSSSILIISWQCSETLILHLNVTVR